MGGSIAKGLAKSKFISPENISVSDLSSKVLDGLKAFNPALNTTNSNLDCIKDASIILLAVKPWQMESVVSTLKYRIDYSKQVIVSIAASVPFERLHEILEKDGSLPAILRVVPNTAIAIGQSMTFIANSNASKEQETMVVDIFDQLGKTMVIGENQFEAATALGSCGTAFAMRYIRAAMEAGIQLGFYPHLSLEIILQTVGGAVALLEESGSHPEVEIDKVTTPGGITIKGINEMEHCGFSSAVIKAHKAAK